MNGGHAAELGDPHHQRIPEEAALSEVLKQRCRGTVEDETVEAIVVGQILVTVPVNDTIAVWTL